MEEEKDLCEQETASVRDNGELKEGRLSDFV